MKHREEDINIKSVWLENYTNYDRLESDSGMKKKEIEIEVLR